MQLDEDIHPGVLPDAAERKGRDLVPAHLYVNTDFIGQAIIVSVKLHGQAGAGAFYARGGIREIVGEVEGDTVRCGPATYEGLELGDETVHRVTGIEVIADEKPANLAADVGGQQQTPAVGISRSGEDSRVAVNCRA